MGPGSVAAASLVTETQAAGVEVAPLMKLMASAAEGDRAAPSAAEVSLARVAGASVAVERLMTTMFEARSALSAAEVSLARMIAAGTCAGASGELLMGFVRASAGGGMQDSCYG